MLPFFSFLLFLFYNILCNNVALQRAQKNEMNCEKCARLGWVRGGVGWCEVCVWIGGLVGLLVGFAFELNYIRAAGAAEAAAAAAPSAVWQFVIFSKWQVTLPAVLDQEKLHTV